LVTQKFYCHYGSTYPQAPSSSKSILALTISADVVYILLREKIHHLILFIMIIILLSIALSEKKGWVYLKKVNKGLTTAIFVIAILQLIIVFLRIFYEGFHTSTDYQVESEIME